MRSLNALESEPCFCYGGHVDAVRAIFRRLCVMSSLHSCWHPGQVRYAFEQWQNGIEKDLRQTGPIFFVAKSAQPIPAAMMDGLKELSAVIVEVGSE